MHLEKKYDAIVQLKSETVYRTWRLYNLLRHAGRIGADQRQSTLLAKPVKGKMPLPICREDLYP
jgi:hypothetical protein